MWGVLSRTDPQNQDNKRYLLLHQYLFTLDYVKHHVNILQKGSKVDQYVVQNMTW